MAMRQPITDLRGLGPKSQAMLAKVGIDSLVKLRKRGAVPTYVGVKRADKTASLNLLYGLVGAIENCDWREVQLNRKLELLNAIESYERSHPGKSELGQLRNIGKAMLKDFEQLGITSVKQLARCSADSLYARIQEITHTRHDPCVWDTYAAAIHQAKTGEAQPWWGFTKVRKEREKAGKFVRSIRSTPRPAHVRKGRVRTLGSGQLPMTKRQ